MAHIKLQVPSIRRRVVRQNIKLVCGDGIDREDVLSQSDLTLFPRSLGL